MKYEYIDTHSHLNLNHFDNDRDDIAQLCAEKSVVTITIGTNLDDSKLAVELADKHDNLYAIVGIHPTEVGKVGEIEPHSLEKLLNNPKVVGIGECGLDYFRCPPEMYEKQETVFRSQLDLATENDLPVMLHVRPSQGSMDAYIDVLKILSEYKKQHGDMLRGQAHFFVGTADIAQQFIDLGFYISFTGVITFTYDYNDVIKMVPGDKILSETDSPFVAPVPYRGKRAEPWQVISVVEKIAEIRDQDLETTKKQLMDNAKELYKV
ncbi:MAG: TatD family hydrolase [Candidatus Nomurabacteria bacterium]|nr:TatD family hydrolase [Candidatus Nomurabacteria bacterium]